VSSYGACLSAPAGKPTSHMEWACDSNCALLTGAATPCLDGTRGFWRFRGYWRPLAFCCRCLLPEGSGAGGCCGASVWLLVGSSHSRVTVLGSVNAPFPPNRSEHFFSSALLCRHKRQGTCSVACGKAKSDPAEQTVLLHEARRQIPPVESRQDSPSTSWVLVGSCLAFPPPTDAIQGNIQPRSAPSTRAAKIELLRAMRQADVPRGLATTLSTYRSSSLAHKLTACASPCRATVILVSGSIRGTPTDHSSSTSICARVVSRLSTGDRKHSIHVHLFFVRVVPKSVDLARCHTDGRCREKSTQTAPTRGHFSKQRLWVAPKKLGRNGRAGKSHLPTQLAREVCEA